MKLVERCRKVVLERGYGLYEEDEEDIQVYFLFLKTLFIF